MQFRCPNWNVIPPGSHVAQFLASEYCEHFQQWRSFLGLRVVHTLAEVFRVRYLFPDFAENTIELFYSASYQRNQVQPAFSRYQIYDQVVGCPALLRRKQTGCKHLGF